MKTKTKKLTTTEEIKRGELLLYGMGAARVECIGTGNPNGETLLRATFEGQHGESSSTFDTLAEIRAFCGVTEKPKRKRSGNVRDEVLKSLGLTKVKGVLGGVYWE